MREFAQHCGDILPINSLPRCKLRPAGFSFFTHPRNEALPAGSASTRALDELAESLTRRELEVLQMLAAGLSNKEIAAKLNISEHTVKFTWRPFWANLRHQPYEAVSLGIAAAWFFCNFGAFFWLFTRISFPRKWWRWRKACDKYLPSSFTSRASHREEAVEILRRVLTPGSGDLICLDPLLQELTESRDLIRNLPPEGFAFQLWPQPRLISRNATSIREKERETPEARFFSRNAIAPPNIDTRRRRKQLDPARSCAHSGLPGRGD